MFTISVRRKPDYVDMELFPLSVYLQYQHAGNQTTVHYISAGQGRTLPTTVVFICFFSCYDYEQQFK